MDERFIMELIEDLDHMRQLLERCVKKLRSQVSPDAKFPSRDLSDMVSSVGGPQSDIRAEIERQRQAILSQVEQVKAQAMSAVATARTTGMSMPSGVPGGMPGVMPGGMPGGFGVPPSPELFEKLRQQMVEQEKKK